MTARQSPRLRSNQLPLATSIMLLSAGLGALVLIGDATGIPVLDDLGLLIPYAIALWVFGVVLTILRLVLYPLSRARRVSSVS